MSSAPTTARQRWRRTWVELKAAAFPVAAFWAMTFLSMATFFGLLIGTKGFDADAPMIMTGFAIVTFGGIGIGQIMALLRLRTWVVAAAVALFWAAGIAFAAAQPPLPDVMLVVFGITIFLGPFFLLAGLWSLRVHMGLLATWAPLVWLTGAIIVIAEDYTGSVSNWHAGEKWAVWDLLSLPVLLLGVVFLIAYLSARERHRVQLWRFAPGGPDLPRTQAERRTKGRLGAWLGGGCGTLLAVLGLAIVITAAAALAAPYLWRTGSNDGEEEQPQPVEQPAPQPEEEPNQGCNQQQQQQPDEGEQETPTPEQIQEAVKNAGISLVTLILVLLFALIGLFIFLPPLRRALILRHLRKPLWPVPPTRQVLQAWRVVEIALADIDIRRRPGDSAEALARRAITQLPPDVDHAALLRSAALADRVLFGLGVDPRDPEECRRAAEMTYQVVWELLSEAGRLRAVYRFF